MQAHIPVQKKRSASKNYDVGDLILPVPGPNITEEVLLFTNLTNLTINSTEGGLRDLSILGNYFSVFIKIFHKRTENHRYTKEDRHLIN
jgi:hypothetical protein